MRTTRRHRTAAALVVAGFALAACEVPGGEPQPAPRLSASPNPLVLSATAGGPADSGSVTITNTGTADTNPLVVTPLGSFTPTSDSCSGAVLSPTESCSLGFSYPAASGVEARDSSVLVTSPGDAVVANVRVEGTTTLPG